MFVQPELFAYCIRQDKVSTAERMLPKNMIQMYLNIDMEKPITVQKMSGWIFIYVQEGPFVKAQTLIGKCFLHSRALK